MSNVLVTKRSLEEAIVRNPVHTIGRALMLLYKYGQTDDEQDTNATHYFNGVGFTGSDARSGSITARYYMKHGTLLDWQIERWTKRNAKGRMRIAKYHRQLNEFALAKAAGQKL